MDMQNEVRVSHVASI